MSSSARGIKRKRKIDQEEDPILEKLKTKLHHVIKDVKKAAKKGKTFEIQKTVKKLKQLRTEDASSEEVKSMELQLEAIKAMHHEQVALVALLNKIHKDRVLQHISTGIITEQLGSLSNSTLHKEQESISAKVESRLLSSKYLASEINEVLTSLRVVLSPPLQKKEVDPSTKASITLPSSLTANVQKEEQSDDDTDQDTWESGSINDSEGIKEKQDESTSDDDQSLASSQPTKKRKLATTIPKNPPVKSKVATSTFLPSLSVGFTKGDSDASDWSGDEESTAPERKNRRGQRARKAIWEKKYGKNANHLKKQREEAYQSSVRARTSSIRRQNDKRRMTSLPTTRDQGWPRPKSVQPAPQVDSRPAAHRPKAPDKPLHPSWEAKRKLKEKESAKIVPSQGKKIVFS